MEQQTTRPEPERLVSLASHLLSLRDFTNSREHALSAQKSDPNLSGPDQILAVTNVLLAAERRLPNHHHHHLDWYSILQIPRPGPVTRPEIETRFKKLISLLNPTKNNLPFSQEALKLVRDAWSVLSDPEKKTRYDNEINNGCNGAKNENVDCNRPQKGEKTQERSENEGKKSFWTVCPYCFYMYEYERVYEECCLRCQNCRRAFHGVALEEGLRESVVVEGKEEYYCGVGVFPLGYSSGCGNLGDKKPRYGDKSGGDGGWDNVVEISDDSDEEMDIIVKTSGGGGGEVKNVGVEEVKEEVVKGGVGEVGGVMQGSEKVEVRNDGKRVMKNVKSVARNSKKIMGKGVKSRRTERVSGPRVGGVELKVEFGNGDGGNGNRMKAGSGNGNGVGCFEDEDEDELEFFEGDDDFFVGLKNSV